MRDEPADPGTYGEPPRGARLPADLQLGPVHLQVADLDRSVGYYEQTLGLRVAARDGSHAALAAGDGTDALVHLHERPGVRSAPTRRRLGLFHFAIVVPDRAALGRFVRHLADVDARVGAANHLVSESLYLQDPDNLGIEVYADRPRATWRRIGRELQMATDPLDVAGLLREAGDAPWTHLPAGTRMGHLHLHVGGLDDASAFFSDTLGFDRMVWTYPGALFLSAGGYHHHLGANIWAGPGAGPAPEDEARLIEWTIDLPTAGDVAAVRQRLVQADHAPSPDVGDARDGNFVVTDPWGTPIRVRTRAAAAWSATT
jgi:catechol 2,3-dioxygenase